MPPLKLVRLFPSYARFEGDIGSLSVADSLCANTAAGLALDCSGGVFAMLSSCGSPTDCGAPLRRFGVPVIASWDTRPIYALSGTLVANSFASLRTTSGNVLAATLSKAGVLSSDVFWTGAGTGGLADGYDCAGWTSQAKMSTGNIGATDVVTDKAVSDGVDSCLTALYFLCACSDQ